MIKGVKELRLFNKSALIVISVFFCFLSGTIFLSAKQISYKDSDIGNIEAQERSTNLYYHNNQIDRLWYGSNRWSVRFDLSSQQNIDAFRAEQVKIFFPQAGGLATVEIYSDTVQPLDSLLVVQENHPVIQGWNTIDLPAAEYPEGKSFWLVFEYETSFEEEGTEDRFVAGSSNGGERSYFWIPPTDNIAGHFVNFGELNISSELIVNLVGELLFSGFDLELLDFRLLGDIYPNSQVIPYALIRNNSSENFEDMIGLRVELNNATNQNPMDVTIPVDLSLSGKEEISINFPEYAYTLAPDPADYRLRVELQTDLDHYLDNNRFEQTFNTFTTQRDAYLIENFLRHGHNPSDLIISDQEALMQNSYDNFQRLNYFFHPADEPFYSVDAAIHKDYYRLTGYPFSIIDGTEIIAGHFADYSQILEQTIEDAYPATTFIQPVFGSTSGIIDPNELIVNLNFTLRNNRSYIFQNNLSSLRLFIALVEKEIPETSGKTLLTLHRYPTGSLSLGYEQEQRFEWASNLQAVQTIHRPLNLDNLSYFDVIYWLQNSETKRVYYVKSHQLDSFSLETNVDNYHDEPNLQPHLSAFPNPLSGDSSLSFSINGYSNARNVALKVYNIKGQLVYQFQLDSPERVSRFQWDTRDLNGNRVGSGLYFIRAEYEQPDGKQLTDHQRLIIVR